MAAVVLQHPRSSRGQRDRPAVSEGFDPGSRGAHKWTYDEQYFAAKGITAALTVLPAEDPDDIRERYFGKRARIRPRGRKLQPDRRLFDRGYSNELTGLDRIEELIEQARFLRSPRPTAALVRAADLDEKTGIGALRMLDHQEICHCRSGGRSQLLWYPGPRKPGEDPPRLLRREASELLIDVLRQSSEEWLATDYLMRQTNSRENSSARKNILGALKVLVVLGLAETAKYGRQAVVWQWTGAGGLAYPVYDRRRVLPQGGRKRGAKGGWVVLSVSDQWDVL